MAFQQTIEFVTRGRGTFPISDEVARIVHASGVNTGLANIFAMHTSCSLILTENADPTVRRDLETLAQRWAPDGDDAYRHDQEGDDDMAAHARHPRRQLALHPGRRGPTQARLLAGNIPLGTPQRPAPAQRRRHRTQLKRRVSDAAWRRQAGGRTQ